MGRAASSELSWCRGMRSVPEKIFAMNRVATPLLSLGSGPSLPGVISLHLITALLSGGILNRHLPGWTSRQDLGYQHPALATDWTLPQRRAGEFFIALTIVLGGFQGRGFGRWH